MTTNINPTSLILGRFLCHIGIHRYRWIVWLGAYDVSVCTRCDKTNPNQST